MILREKYTARTSNCLPYPTEGPRQQAKITGTVHNFINEIAKGDTVITYNPNTRLYYVGEVAGAYRFDSKLIQGQHHVIPMKWIGKVRREALSGEARRSLGSIMTLFKPKQIVKVEIDAILAGGEQTPAEAVITETEETLPDVVNTSKELISDIVDNLEADEMELLVAALLRAMGFKTRMTDNGADQGSDILASPDGLGLQEPRIHAEVKHRKGQMGAPEVRNFIGTLRAGDKGLYVSTGGFSREAKYEAKRAEYPVNLVTLPDLVDLLVEHYETLDYEGRAMVALVKVYWPA